MNPICIYTENEVHHFIITEKDITLTHLICNEEDGRSRSEVDLLYKRTLIRSLCIPTLTIQTPILRLTNTSCTVSLGMKDRGCIILFHTTPINEEIRSRAIELFTTIYKAQIPSSPANPVAVTPFTSDETSEPPCQSVTEAAAATSPKSPMIPTSERRTNVSV